MEIYVGYKFEKQIFNEWIIPTSSIKSDGYCCMINGSGGEKKAKVDDSC